MSSPQNPQSLACEAPPGVLGDLVAAAQAVTQGRLAAAQALEDSLRQADGEACRHAFVRRFDSLANQQAAAVDAARAAGAPVPPLAGLALSIKDLFDVAGQPTTAASASLADALPAAADAPAVARLRAAGAALVGHTNLTEFAFSGVGINPHHNTPANAATRLLDATPRIPGGSTSGGAVSVAAGAAWAALGSDTRGSIRVPAALHGLVGFKSSRTRVPTEGCLPLSFTLDTACAITRSVRDAVLLHEVLAARTVRLRQRGLAHWRLAVPQGSFLEQLEPTVAAAFERALGLLRRAGAQISDIRLPEPEGLAAPQASGNISAAEAWAWHRGRLGERGHLYDPRVLQRIRLGEPITAGDYLEGLRLRSQWMARMAQALDGVDALLSPTVPMVAPPLAPLLADDEAFFATNARLLRNPSVVNHLDGCALSLPMQAPGELPVGLMVWAGADADDELLEVSLRIEAALAEQGLR